jgi:hypothetical protein
MKKLMIISIALSTIFTFSTMAIAKNNHKLPPAPVGDEITACYKKVNGQLRMVSDAGQCRPSEFPISWSIGPIASSISGIILPISGGATQWVFAGPTVIVDTTASQRITGVVQATLGILSGTASFGYDLCYSPEGTSTVVNFAGLNSPIGIVTSGQHAFTASGSVAPGAGTWLVGFCVFNDAVNALDTNDVVNGWIMITK